MSDIHLERGAGSIPSIGDLLAAAAIPDHFFGARFERTPSLTVREVGGRRLVEFGKVMTSGSMCVDVETGEVVEVKGVSVWHTNQSILDFAACVVAVLARWPFDKSGRDLDGWEAVAASVEAELRTIDPTSMAADGFWETLRWDLAQGDFAPDVNPTGWRPT